MKTHDMILNAMAKKISWLPAAEIIGSDRYYDFIVVLDDATSEIYCAQSVEEESTRTVMTALREAIERKGLFARYTAIGGVTSSTRRKQASQWTSRG